MEPVDRQLEAFNRHDLSSFLDCYSTEIVLASLSGGIFVRGLAEMKAYYRQLFRDAPTVQARLLHRITLGPMVVDHERIYRSEDPADHRDSVVIYRIHPAGRIDAVWFAR